MSKTIKDNVLKKDYPDQFEHQQGKILAQPVQHPLRAYLNRDGLEKPSLNITSVTSEHDIMHCLPVQARLGVVMIKNLLRQFDKNDYFLITSYMVKNALFCLLHNKIERGKMKKLEKSHETEQWITNSIAKEFEEEGKQWAIEILCYVKKTKTLFFSGNELDQVWNSHPICGEMIRLLGDN